jgi:UDP-N-acetylglucosamine transferase subunit ALG13
MKRGNICISPIDWGLGHATRCIPLIQSLQQLGYTIYIATEGHHEVILKESIPGAHFLTLRGYRIKYSQNKNWFIIAMLLQIPQIIFSVLYEYFWLKEKAKKIHFDLIISDNRFGFYHKKITSVFITHQLNLQTPFAWSTLWFQQLQYYWYQKFKAVWVPDIQQDKGLAGILSHPTKLPSTPVWYMGCLSRLHQNSSNGSNFSYYATTSKPIEFLGIVSGPEPQRSVFEKLLWEQGKKTGKSFVVVGGTPLHPKQEQYENGILYSHLSAKDLASQIQQAKYIICRGGYTSLMELIPFKKKLILVPTPGQTEQEYLGQLWQQKNWAICLDQNNFNINDVITTASGFLLSSPPFEEMSQEALIMQLKKLSLY